MFAPPLHVSYKVYGKGAESHPDLDDRCLQVAMEDRHARQQRQGQRRRRQRDTVDNQEEKLRLEGDAEEAGEEEDGLFVFSPAREGWLIKQGSGGLRIWRRRWVGLADRKLYYGNGPAAPGGGGGGDHPEKGSIGCMELTQWSRVVEEDSADGLSFRVIPGKPEDAYLSEGGEEEEEEKRAVAQNSEDDPDEEDTSDGTPTHSVDGDAEAADAAPGTTGETQPPLSPRRPTHTHKHHRRRRSTADSAASSGSQGQGHGHVPTEGWWFRAESLQEKEVWMTKIRESIALAEWWSALRLGPSLGEGGFSQVVEILDMRKGERLAVKIMQARRRMERDQALAETDILALVGKRIRHPHLMAPRRIYVEKNRVSIMFPLCRGGDLFQRLVSRGRGPETEAAVIVSRLLSAVQALHRHGVLHLDIKPENVLFAQEEDPSQVLLTDFGLSRKMHPTTRRGVRGNRGRESGLERSEKEVEGKGAGDESGAEKGKGEEEGEEEGGEEEEEEEDAEQDWDYLSRLRYNLAFDERVNGTIGYLAPEVILHKRYTPAADVWGLGVVLHILLVGYAPFQGNRQQQQQQQQRQQEMDGSCSRSSHQDALERSVRGEFVMDQLDWARVSPAAKGLTQRMLIVDETARITIADALRHPWLESKEGKGVEAVGGGGKGRDLSSAVAAGKKGQARCLPSNRQGHENDRLDGGTTQPSSSFRTLFDSVVGRGSSFLSSITRHNNSPSTSASSSSSSSSSSS